MFDLLVPDGPLHPTDALVAVAVGVALGLVTRSGPRRWVGAVVVAVAVVASWRHGSVLLDGYRNRSETVFAVGATVVPVALAALRRSSIRQTAWLCAGALAGVWTIVPDTEVPLIAGAALVGALAARPGDVRSRLAALLVLLPTVAAVAGSVGRPDRLEPALLVAALGAGLVGGLIAGGRQIQARRQRAGTPTTVAAGGTSSTTTAPAPTIAP